jgi:hypothetical protein
MFQPVPPPICGCPGQRRISRGSGSTYVNPDTLGVVGTVLCSLLHELSCYQPQHIFAAPQQPLPRRVVDTRLRFVEALKSILLAISSSVAGMRLEERGIKEAQEGSEGAWIFLIFLCTVESDGKYKANKGN